jgi:hypothetical protein
MLKKQITIDTGPRKWVTSDGYSALAQQLDLGMVRRRSMQIGNQERLGGRPLAPPLRFHCYEDRVDLLQNLGIVELERPTTIGLIIHIEDAEANGSRLA